MADTSDLGTIIQRLLASRQQNSDRLDSNQNCCAGAGSSSSSAYVLRSLLPASIREKYVEAGTVQHDKGFAMVVFSLLATNAGKISEGEVLTLRCDREHQADRAPDEDCHCA